MAYTVRLPYPNKDFEFQAFVRLLEQKGVDISTAERVEDSATGHRWLHSWENRAEAESFARELREETGNGDWEVAELAPTVRAVQEPLIPIEILVTQRSDGSTYGLAPTSRNRIRKRFPSARLIPAVFLAGDAGEDIEATQKPIWDEVARILTGLTERELDELGGYRILETKSKRVLRTPELVH